MKIIRYEYKNEPASYGWLLDDPAEGRRVGQILGNPFGEFRRNEAEIPFEDVRLLSPVNPSKIVCVGRNYAAHAAELGNEVPEVPLLFLKPPSTLIGADENIILPPQSNQVEHEAELALVIGKQGRWIDPEEAMDYVFGYTIANDVTARDLQRRDKTWARGKGFDTFCPVGPWIETDYDGTDVLVSCHVNDELRQMASTRDMVFSPRQLIAYVSSIMTLESGDLLLTGTPAGVGLLNDGDLVSITVEGLGSLNNRVVGWAG